MSAPQQRFETPLLTLRPPRPEDAEAAFSAYANDPEVTRFLVWHAYCEVEPLRLFFSQCNDTWEKGGPGHYPWLIRLQKTQAIIGSVSVTLDRHNAVLGYVIGRKYWGQGYATEAARTVIDWAKTLPHIYRVWAYCDVNNPASARVMEKAGLSREAILRRWHVCSGTGPEPRDCIACAWTR